MMPMRTLRYYGVDHVLPQDAEAHIEVEDESQRDQNAEAHREVEDESQRDQSPIPPISDESPIPEVRATVSTIDDPAPALTLRVGIIGPLVTFLVAHLKTLELFKENAFEIPMVVIQFCFGLLLGRVLAAILPERVIRVPGTQFQFSLNPEPFNSKEHALICVFAYVATMRPNLLQTVAITKAYFHNDIHWPVAFAATLSSYLMCFLFVGLFTRHLVSAAHMWWPMELVDVAFFRTWHDNTEGSLGNISSKKFFMIFFVLGSIYQMIMGFLFPFIPYISFICLIWKKSETAQQIGAGKNGLGLFSFSMDWSSFNSSTGDPLATPRLVILNLLVGYFITLYMLIPSVYWSNAFGSKKFPMMSTDPYDAYGHPYNFSRVLNSNGTFNEAAYEDYSNVHWTALTVILYSLLLGSVATSLVQVVMDRKLYTKVEEDIHNRLMRRNQPVPRSWFITISTLAFVLAIICGSAPFGPEVNFPISAVLAACVTALIVVIPLGIFAATTGEMLPVNAAFGLIGGFLFSNKLLDCMIYNNFAYQIATNTVQFMGFLKLAHFMQISLRAMWAVMVVASLIVCSVSFHETWYQVNKPENPCVQQELPTGSISSNCPMLDMFYNRFNMWGIIGSRRIISDGNYGTFLLFVIVVSVVAQVVLSLLARRWKCLYAIKLPIVLAASAEIPFAGTANVNTWLLVGVVFPVIAYTRVRGWSPKWQYLLATALSGGTAFSSGMLLPFIRKLIDSPKWWGSTLDDHCHLPGSTVERFVWH